MEDEPHKTKVVLNSGRPPFDSYPYFPPTVLVECIFAQMFAYLFLSQLSDLEALKRRCFKEFVGAIAN